MGVEAERRLFVIAGRQRGVVTRADCAAVGLGRFWIEARIGSGALQPLQRNVFKVGAGPLAPEQQELAALLAVGDDAVLSHYSAARWLGLPCPKVSRVHLMVPEPRRPTALRGIEVWRSRDLRAEDITSRGPYRITRLGRTVVDLAAVLDERWLRAVVDGAQRLSRSNLGWMQRALQQHGHGRTGAKLLRELLEANAAESEVADSVLESFAMELGLATGRMPRLHWCVELSRGRRIELDLAWPEVRLGVELDGYAFHSSREAFDRDRARDRELNAVGWTVLRYTWRDFTGGRQATIEQLRQAHASAALSRRP